jgi:hypothetical protein
MVQGWKKITAISRIAKKKKKSSEVVFVFAGNACGQERI